MVLTWTTLHTLCIVLHASTGLQPRAMRMALTRGGLCCWLCTAGALDAAGIPYTPAPAGMFLWLDLRATFGPNNSKCSGSTGSSSGSTGDAEASGSWQAEAELWQYMLDVHKLVLTPGERAGVGQDQEWHSSLIVVLLRHGTRSLLLCGS